MLVLTRKQSETIHIGDDVVIKIIQTGRGSIKLGIEAPVAVRVLRGEVADEIQ
ncbi:MAG: carbon storage regulator, partial [Planctomycetaceae bacterium]